jgi:catechol 2,3-dioxygenase-like lactoylglutathione lyase family enzyme
MSRDILGIHHVTAIAGDPQTNLDFYAGVLGLRLVKLTVNFDDPGTYHLYYGDGSGQPGTILTFFPWPDAPKGLRGTGQVTETAFAIPSGSISFWTKRLAANQVAFKEPFERFGELVISFNDPHGLGIELIATMRTSVNRAYQAGPVPLEHAICGFHSATLSEADLRKTAALLEGTLKFKLAGQEGNRSRYAIGSGDGARTIDVLSAPDERPGRIAAGSVHHIAWRTTDDEQQREWFRELNRLNYPVSPVMDRKYFHSIYFREPGNILFEIATDPPGFAIDETLDELGSHLVLPPWLERDRAKLQSILPPLRLPSTTVQVTGTI